MAIYGSYETVSSLLSSGLTTVWTARPLGAEPDDLEQFVVKVLHPVDIGGGEAAEREALRAFLDAARVQATVAAHPGAHWAPVRESGTAEGEAYYVTDYFPHSALDLMRVNLDARALHVVIHSVVQGLLELREACGRPHGNLKPSNVLISSGEDIARTRVVLADPTPTAELELGTAAVDDIRAVGELIYRLVLRKAPQALGDRVVQASEEWRALGRNGERWRSLASRLLMSPEELSLEALAKEVEALKEKPFPLRPVLITLGALAVAAVVILAFLLKPPPEPELGDWRELCKEYDEWFAAFYRDLNQERRARWASDTDLNQIVELLNKADLAKQRLNPRDIVGDWQRRYADLREDPPPEAATPEARRLTLSSLEIVRETKRILAPGGWSKLTRLDKLQRTWQERGWNGPARFLRLAVLKIKPYTRLALAVDRVLELAQSDLIRSIEKRWKAIEDYQRRFQDSGDPVLAAFGGWVRDETASPDLPGTTVDLQELDHKLAVAEQLARKLAAVLDDAQNGLVDLERFRSEAKVIKDFDGKASEHVLGTRWLNEVRDFYLLRPDPRGSRDDWQRSLRPIENGLAELREAAGDGRKWADKFARRLQELQAEGATLFALPPIRRDAPILREKLRSLTEQRDKLKERLDTALTLFTENPAQWFARVTAFAYQPPDGPINTEWLKRRAAILPKTKQAVVALSRDDYRRLKQKVRVVQDLLSRLDQGLPADVPPEAAPLATRAWFAPFRKLLSARRADAQRKALVAVPWDDGAPRPDAQAFVTLWENVRKDYEKFRSRLAQLVVGIGAIEDALDAGYQLDETPPAVGKPLRSAFAQLQADPLLSASPELARALVPLAERIERLAATATLTDRKALVAAALSAREPGVALAAWRALGRLTKPPWPSSASEWESEKKILARLGSDVRSIPDAQRAKALGSELARAGAAREVAWLERRFASLRAAIVPSGDEVLAHFAKFADAELGALPAGDPSARLAKLRKLCSLAERIARVASAGWAKRVHRDLFVAEGSAYRQLKQGGKVSAALFELWLKEVESYYYLAEDDPLRVRHARLVARGKGARSAIEALRKDDPKAAERLEARLDALLARLPAPVKKNEKALPEALDKAEPELSAISRKLGVYLEVVRLERQIEEVAASAERAADRDPIVAAVPEWLRAQVGKARGADIELRKSLLADLATWTADLAAFLTRKWPSPDLDLESFAAQGQAYEQFKSTRKLTRELVEDWMKEAKGYFRISPDPREPKEKWEKKHEDIKALIARAEEFGSARVAQFRKQLDDLATAKLQKLREIPPLVKNKAAIEQQVKALQAAFSDLEARIRREIEPASEWRKRIATSEAPAAEESVKAVWRTRRDAILKLYPEGRLAADAQLYLSARTGVKRSLAFLRDFDEAVAKALPAPPADWPTPLADEAARHRKVALEKLLGAVPWQEKTGFVAGTFEGFRAGAAWRAAVADYGKVFDGLRKFRGDLARVVRMLREGYLPDQEPPQGETIVSTLARLDRQPELVASFERELGPARRLIAIARLDRKGLANLADEPQAGDPRQTPLLVWKRLGALDDWPSGLHELKTEASLRDRVADAAKAFARAGHGDVVRWVESELKSEGLKRWQRAFNALAIAEAKDKDAALDEVVTLAPRFGIADPRTAPLSPVVKLRYLVFDLKRAVSRLARDATKAEVGKLVDAFEREVKALPGGMGSRAQVRELIRQMREAVAAAEEKGGAGLEKAGPARFTFGGGWQAKAAEDGSAVTYAWSETGETLRFVRVEPSRPADARPAYVCTTEFPVGLFVGVVKAADKWGEVGKLLAVGRLAGFDVRKGPRCWRVERGGAQLGLARRWLVPIPGVEPYPGGAAPPRPSRRHPVQYVSPEAAMLVARLLGCRLPASWEWAAAFERFAKGRAGAKGANLRDRRWLAQREHVAAQWGKGLRASWPDADIFLPPAGAEGAEGVKRGREALSVVEGDDGSLWFAPVGSGEAMEGLVGNVAELVFDAPAALEGAPLDGLPALAEKLKGKLGVVGGSALSPPELWDGKGRPFERVWPVELARAREGYSDVGFRLAFTAPKVGPRERVARVLRSHDYLPGLE